MSSTTWEAVIGLEVHCQLMTKSKIFSGAATAYGAEPNTQADGVTLGFPGVLPVLNGDALRMAVTFGLAVGAEVAERCVFARNDTFEDKFHSRQVSHATNIIDGSRLGGMILSFSHRRSIVADAEQILSDR